MKNKPLLLSLCIPTNGAIEFVIPVLESIYNQEDADKTKFEVIIADNGSNSMLETTIQPFLYHGNLRYIATSDRGFFNLITSLKLGRGIFCKMINHRSILVPGSITAWIMMVEKYMDLQPIIYCSDNNIKGEDEIFCDDFDFFVRKMSYYTSWSAGLGIWNRDKQIFDKIQYNEMFPNTSLLFEMRQESKYVIWNKKYQNMLEEPTKGGYNIFHTFAVVYLDLLKDLERKGRISPRTFISVKKKLRTFLASWYYEIVCVPNQFTFSIDGYKNNILKYYNFLDYLIIKYKGKIAFLVKNMLKSKI